MSGLRPIRINPNGIRSSNKMGHQAVIRIDYKTTQRESPLVTRTALALK